MTAFELLVLGSDLNRQKEHFPLGINVNVWHIAEMLYVKTYERGVQRLTKSCGTGSMSCAAYYKREGKVHVANSGGILEIAIYQDTIE